MGERRARARAKGATMATVQVILNGMPGGTVHDTEQYPVVLRFDEDKSVENAVWVIPSFPGEIPASMLSEIRVQTGPLQAMVDGPEGFKTGPHETTWIRCDYPRGKLVSFLQTGGDTHRMTGVSVSIVEDSLVVDELSIGPGSPPSGGSSAASSQSGTSSSGGAQSSGTGEGQNPSP
jgi:hypothetical protein